MNRLILTLFILVGFTLPGIAQQTDEIAAIAQVTHADVSFQRQNTSAPLALPQGAIAPFGSGDTLYTDDTGRVLIHFGDVATALILPESALTLESFTPEALTATVQGLVVFEFDSDNFTLNLNTAELSVTQPAAAFAMWSDDDSPDTVIVSRGSATVTAEDNTYTLNLMEGYHTAYEAVITLTPPLNEARLIGQVAGCEGTVDTEDDENLLVRAGSSFDALSMGAIADGETVDLLAISSNGLRYRVQHLSDFGWVEALAIETTCADLPELPVPYTEFFRRTVDITAEESVMLAPYYGPPLEDPWFYRFTSRDNIPPSSSQ